MKERKQLNKLVIATLQVSNTALRATELYDKFRRESPQVLRTEQVHCFRSFVKVVNSFDGVVAVGSNIKRYTLEK